MCCIDQSLGVRVISWQQFPFEKFSLIGTNKATTWLSLGSHQTCHSTVTLTATFTTVPYTLTAGRNTPPPNIYLLNWAIWTHACNEKMGLLQICTWKKILYRMCCGDTLWLVATMQQLPLQVFYRGLEWIRFPQMRHHAKKSAQFTWLYKPFLLWNWTTAECCPGQLTVTSVMYFMSPPQDLHPSWQQLSSPSLFPLGVILVSEI